METMFEAYVTNAGKYSEGQLVGETLKFPTTAQEVEALLKRIGVDTPKFERPRRRIAAGYAIAALGMALVVVSQFTHLYYTFDAQNYYHRTVWHPISLLIPMVGMLLDGSLLVQYRKSLNHQLYLAMLSYIALPFAAAIGLLFIYGISLVNIAISISLFLIFIFSLVEQN